MRFIAGSWMAYPPRPEGCARDGDKMLTHRERSDHVRSLGRTPSEALRHLLHLGATNF